MVDMQLTSVVGVGNWRRSKVLCSVGWDWDHAVAWCMAHACARNKVGSLVHVQGISSKLVAYLSHMQITANYTLRSVVSPVKANSLTLHSR